MLPCGRGLGVPMYPWEVVGVNVNQQRYTFANSLPFGGADTPVCLGWRYSSARTLPVGSPACPRPNNSHHTESPPRPTRETCRYASGRDSMETNPVVIQRSSAAATGPVLLWI